MHILMIVFDLLILLGASLRVTRLITTDSIPGEWWIQQPLMKRAYGSGERDRQPRWAKYLTGLECPFCVGFWVCVVAVVVLWAVGGPGHAAEWWRWVAGAFALNYVVGHVSGRMD